ncbi:unnamed protein product [Mytilus edulis]|uniref:C-type lectin domain-containing protein n=2 Tax=Mytilus TaxID=6548 RepID=A0A8S3TIC5_MYTED|nr:unnamed protein product [Mytilus edulis]
MRSVNLEMRSVNLEMRSVNLEMKCVNLEMRSVNLEMRSLNHEMRSVNLEMRSVNLEMKCVNLEMRSLHCRALHAALLEIPDAETNEFVKGHLKSRDGVTNTIYFIGATDIAKEGNWEWNGSKTPLVFTDWGHRQPDHLNHTENCLALRHAEGFKWHDYPCHDHHRFICAAER